ncbi:putative bifunctional diguanylate cyclase/phosphodiesterase [Vibrio galatheae]|uniref:putative bifunctional diguanylate cyclase/phosphodiesterase n=1 Tax=Vibrio galatheae TaxID=579748 RepID=UPI000AE7B146|nr:EAL domain-containing protein [Vibrio galatheae]
MGDKPDPVRDSEGTSASSGWLLWGKNLTERFPGDFESILIGENELILVGNDANTSIAVEYPEVEKSQQFITQRTPLNDMSGMLIANLTTTTERTYFIQGNVMFSYLFYAVSVVVLLISFVTFLIFRRRVSARFTDLEKDIDELISAYQLEGLNHPSKDELERLSGLIQALANDGVETKEQLLDTQQKFEALYQSGSIGVLLVRAREVIDVNQTALELLGYQREEIIHQTLDDLCADKQTDECQVDKMYSQFELGQTLFESQLLTRAGEVVDCHIEIKAIQYQGEAALMLSLSDLREKKQQEKLIENLVDRDHLSGLWNRKAIMDKARWLVDERPNQCSFLYIVVPNLSQVAEIYGHQVFDQSIERIAHNFGQYLTPFPIGRISNDEFLVLVSENKDREQARKGTEKIIELLTNKQMIEGVGISLECQAALVASELSHKPLDAQIQAAIYAIQHRHTATLAPKVVDVDATVFDMAETSAAINRDLSGAVRNQQIDAHYQAIVDSKTGEISGFEALARWQHASYGFVSPAVFIPLAEQSALIIELGESILERACQFIAQVNQTRRRAGLGLLTMHVNLSPPHFHYQELPNQLMHLIDKYQIQPGQLVIEVTESMLMGVEQDIVERMENIKSLGVLLALDDFGTGYSSFSTLCSFPLDIVKLDKSYIDHIESNDRARSLVRNISSMAKELGLTTVAEGVETAGQVSRLRNWNVEEIQGYYFYKPVPADEAIRLVNR